MSMLVATGHGCSHTHLNSLKLPHLLHLMCTGSPGLAWILCLAQEEEARAQAPGLRAVLLVCANSSRRASAALVEYVGNAVTAFKTVAGCGERSPGWKPGVDTLQPLDLRQGMALFKSSVSASGNWEPWDEWRLCQNSLSEMPVWLCCVCTY